MPCHLVDTLAAVFTAIGTVGVAILAIWGDKVKDCFFAPRLDLSLVSEKGNLETRQDRVKAYYYHIRVVNRPGRRPATSVMVYLKGVSRRRPNHDFVELPLVFPLPMSWSPYDPRNVERTVVAQETCDFGHMDADKDAFHPSVHYCSASFEGFVKKDMCLRFELVATGHNVSSPRPKVFEVAWNGEWSEDPGKMQNNLSIKEVASLT